MTKLVERRALNYSLRFWGSLFLAISALLICTRIGWSNVVDEMRGPIQSQDRIPTPAGKLLVDSVTGLPAATPMTLNFVRTPDKPGPDGQGRFLIAVNGGYGLEFTSKSKAQQTLSVIDLNLEPEPRVIQDLYFPSPQSAAFGLAFDEKVRPDGTYQLYLSGGFENKIWILKFDPAATPPLSPQNKPDTPLDAPVIDVSAFAENASSPNYNLDRAAVYPLGLALSPDGQTLFVANNLGDTLGIVSDLRNSRAVKRIPLQRPGSTQFVYPYDLKLLTRNGQVTKVYVSLWGDGTIAVIDPLRQNQVSHIISGRHPTAMLFDRDRTRLYVVNSNADTITVIDTATDRVSENIDVRLGESSLPGASPEGMALSEDEKTLYVANAHSNSVAVLSLEKDPTKENHSRIRGLIPTGNYPSAVAVAGGRLFIGNGKGTGAENSSNVIAGTGFYPNLPNQAFPATANKRGMYSAAVVTGNISVVGLPNDTQLFSYTQQSMRNNGLLGNKKTLFAGRPSPFKHAIYIIRENRAYDQVFGDLRAGGDGSRADGEPSVAIFGAGDAARSPGGTAQNITPNARNIALRFGLLDRFFVNSEASPDGHNWSTAAFSNDYVDKAFRWNYSDRGRTYDFEGFNRLPSYDPPANQPPVALPPVFDLPASETDIANFLKRYVPYLSGNRDVGEPESLYLWDAAKRAGLTYRNYGEFIATVSRDDLREVNTQKAKTYPDISPNLTAFATKKTLEGNFSAAHRNFDLATPDIMTVDSYRATRQSNGTIDPAITRGNSEERFRGTSRFGSWVDEFRGYVEDRERGKGDHLPNLSIVRLSNDHTAGLKVDMPTPQFYVADNDYALGRLIAEVSRSPYWKDTAIFVVEDDAQDGPDHVDAHRSPALVISAYNRPGALVHEFHNTVSLIRTMELCLGMQPMNFLDANAVPIDIFADTPDLRPFGARLPEVALDNLFPPKEPTGALAFYVRLTGKQDLRHEDMADPRKLNEIIWFSVKGEGLPLPGIARLPAFDLLTAGVKRAEEDGREDDDRRRFQRSTISARGARPGRRQSIK